MSGSRTLRPEGAPHPAAASAPPAAPAHLRIAIVGGGPAGSFFALYALKYARAARREVSITIYEGKDFRHSGPPGCNMCAGIIPASDLKQFRELDLALPPELILSRVGAYSLHTSAGTISATQPDTQAEIVSVYRGSGPRHGEPLGPVSFDQMLIELVVARGAELRRSYVEAIRAGPPVEVASGGKSESYDLVVLATGVNGRRLHLEGFGYQPPPTSSMCQAELFLGREQVLRRLGSSVHIFLPPDGIASYGILIPKGPYVTVSLLHARQQMRSLRQFLELAEVREVLGEEARQVCGCLPRTAVGLARNIVGEGFVAIGDASATRLYKNGIGSALATAERAAWAAIHRGCSRDSLATHYLPLCRLIHVDNQIGRLLFLQVPLLKRLRTVSMAHHRVATDACRHPGVTELHTRILWGMFTGAHSYRDLFRMAIAPALLLQLALALASSMARKAAPSTGTRAER